METRSPGRHSSAYSEDQYADNYPAGFEHHWWGSARRQILLRNLAGARGSTILDVGCGPGFTVAFLRARGFECWGCDLGRPVVRPGAKEFVFTGTDAGDLSPSLRQRVAVLLLLDVIEHLEEPEEFLRRLLDSFPNARQVVITVPARQELWSAWDERYGHWRRYDMASLRRTVTGGGLRVARIRYIFQSVYPMLLALARTRGRATELQAPRMLWLQRLIAWWFSAEARLPGTGKVPGTSLLAICER